MTMIRAGLLGLGLACSAGLWAQPAPNAQVLGPMWQGRTVQVTGTVIAENGACRQIAVDGSGIPGAGGRLWGCWDDSSRAPDLNARVTVHGRVTTTRMTRMGPYWRVVPQVDGL